MNHHNTEPVTEPIPTPRKIEHPQAIDVAAVRRHMFSTATSKESGFDLNPTNRIQVEVRDESELAADVPVTPAQEVELQKKKQKTNWLADVNQFGLHRTGDK